MTTKFYIIQAVAERSTQEVPTADCATILWAIEATLAVLVEQLTLLEEAE